MSDWYHVHPNNDLIEHNTDGKECECQPRIDYDNHLVVHNALDNREFDEIADEINAVEKAKEIKR